MSDKTVRIGAALALFFFAFALYLFTLHPSISPYRDSGDLITAAATFGLAHPPGYPLYVLSGKAFTTAMPWGNTAYRMNVLSALFGAAALSCLAWAFFLRAPGPLSARALLAPLGALVFLAFSPALWRLSQVSEMYSLNALLAAALIAGSALLGARSPSRQVSGAIFYGLCFLCGLAAGNHPTIVFLIPGLMWYAWRVQELRMVHFINAGVFFLAGLSVYLFLPLRSLTGPLSSWGDPRSLEGLWRMVTRADYGGLRLHPEQSTFQWSAPLVAQHLRVYLTSLGQQFTWPGVALGMWGIARMRQDRWYRFLLISLAVSGPGFVILSNLPPAEATTLPILEPHLVLANVLFAAFIAAAA